MSMLTLPVPVQTQLPSLPVVRPAGENVRRRGSIQQGRALETLGHAVEYLVDSRLFLAEDFDQRNEQEALQILMRCSRAVFAECPEAISLRRRLRRWLADRIPQTGLSTGS